MKAPELKDRLEESEKLIQEMTITWEEKLRKTEEIAQVKQTSGKKYYFFHVVQILDFTLCKYVCLCLQERQKQLESLGISLQSSGIKVGDDKSFLVNLNADPALNELLVYYLKVHLLFIIVSTHKWTLLVWLNVVLFIHTSDGQSRQ